MEKFIKVYKRVVSLWMGFFWPDRLWCEKCYGEMTQRNNKQIYVCLKCNDCGCEQCQHKHGIYRRISITGKLKKAIK